MIWDAFMYSGEADMLECRLYELEQADVPVMHVIVEGTETFTGKPRQLLDTADARWTRWKHKLRHVVLDDLPATGDAWAREHWTRDQIRRGLGDALPDDLIMMSDCDEIPPAWGLDASLAPCYWVQRLICFAVDWEMETTDWQGTVMWRHGSYDGPLHILRGGTFYPGRLGGWHMSWLGGNEAIREKVMAFSHTERVEPTLRGIEEGLYYERGILWSHRGSGPVQLQARDVDETWPRWVYERKCPDNWFRRRDDETASAE